MQSNWQFAQVCADPACSEINRCAPRTDFSTIFPAASLPSDIPNNGLISLNGLWNLQMRQTPHEAVEPCFYDTSDLCMHWPKIPVPSHPELTGFGTPQYVNVMYPWDGREALSVGQLPRQYNPTYYYVTCVTLPALTKGEHAHLRFEGVSSCLSVWVNGTLCGYGEDSFLPSEFEITSLLHNGTNKIAVQVAKWCTGSWLEDQDFWRLCGIFRDVSLRITPAVSLYDFKAAYTLDCETKTASVHVEMNLSGKAVGSTAVCKLLH